MRKFLQGRPRMLTCDLFAVANLVFFVEIDSRPNAIQPRYDHSTTYVTTVWRLLLLLLLLLLLGLLLLLLLHSHVIFSIEGLRERTEYVPEL